MEKKIDENRVAKGFNGGYIISQHDKELSDTLKEGIQPSNDEYIIGLQKGLVELDKDKKLIDDFEKLRTKDQDKGKER
jgi:tRNA uridine 5-carbamoylmethylation protein Kti12